MKLIPRTCRPEAGNKYYIRKPEGYSGAVLGKCRSTGKADSACNVLANCVGYACGRFNEEAGYGKIKYSLVCNAENFYAQAKKIGLKVGKEPKVGGIMVWQKGATLNGSDGAGHVEIVEYKYSTEKIKTSSSGYNSSVWWMETRSIGDGNWREGCSWMGSAYTYLGCIYNPDIDDVITAEPLQKGSKGKEVKELQQKLNKVGNYGLEEDGIFGPGTAEAVKKFQTKYKLSVDGIVGESTMAALNDAYEESALPEGVKVLQMILDDKIVEIYSTVIEGQNYIRLADLDDLGIVKSVSYDKTKKMPVVRS